MKTGKIARAVQIMGTWSVLTIINFLFDSVLYPVMIWRFGPVLGGGTMAIIASIICFGMLITYEKTGKDWLGVNVLEDIKMNGEGWVKELDSKEGIFWWIIKPMLYLPSRIFILVLWIVKKNDFFAFIALNIYQDPFITTIFLRHGRFNGLKRKDWAIFVGSVLFSNIYWILRNWGLVELLRYVFSFFF